MSVIRRRTKTSYLRTTPRRNAAARFPFVASGGVASSLRRSLFPLWLRACASPLVPRCLAALIPSLLPCRRAEASPDHRSPAHRPVAAVRPFLSLAGHRAIVRAVAGVLSRQGVSAQGVG